MFASGFTPWLPTAPRRLLPPPPTRPGPPGAPAELKRGVLSITPRPGLELPHEVWRAAAGGVALALPQDLGQGALRAYLAPYDAYPVWHFRCEVARVCVCGVGLEWGWA